MTMTKPTSEQVTFTSAGAGAALRNLVDKVRENVSVKDFGAVGDGIADDTAAIMAADAAAAIAGKRVYFPAGTYNVAGRTVPLAPSVTWIGESNWYNQFAVANFAPPSIGTIIDAGATNLDTISQNMVAREILNITFKGTGTGSHVNLQSGSRMARIHNCAMHGKDHAIKVSGAVAYILRFSKIFAVRQASDAIFLDFGSGSFNDIEIRDSWIFRPDGRGIFATQTTGGCTMLSVVGNDITDGTGDNAAISISGVAGLRVVGNDIEGWGAIYSDPVNLTGKTGYQPNARCIQASGTSAIIENNVLYGGGNNFSPIRTLTLRNARIGPNRILKDLSTQTFAIAIDAASSNITVEPQEIDFPAAIFVAGGAANIDNRASGSVVSNMAQTFEGSLSITGNTSFRNITEGVVAIGTVGASHTFSLTNGTVHTATLTSATACTFTMPTATAGKRFVLYIRQPASGTPTTATFSGVKWSGGTAPVITATLGRMDIISFSSDGTNWYGSFVQDFTP